MPRSSALTISPGGTGLAKLSSLLPATQRRRRDLAARKKPPSENSRRRPNRKQSPAGIEIGRGKMKVLGRSRHLGQRHRGGKYGERKERQMRQPVAAVRDIGRDQGPYDRQRHRRRGQQQHQWRRAKPDTVRGAARQIRADP